MTTKYVYDKNFHEKYSYSGDDLGAVYFKDHIVFKLWAPLACDVYLNTYSEGSGDNLIHSIRMNKCERGIFSLNLKGDFNKTYYTFSVNNGGEIYEVIDPYAKSAGVNGRRGMVIDLSLTNPDGWEEQKISRIQRPNEAIIYETHIREFTIDTSSSVSDKYKGKYLGFIEKGTKNSSGDSTCFDHLKQLGVNAVQLMPIFDFESIDETHSADKFNWGYDPLNFNVPEGSYSTDAYHGEVRIQELKQLIMQLHASGISVIMDVVYNHTYKNYDSHFNRIVPGYYHRTKEDGSFSNGSGCGNEIASEREMVRKFIVDSVLYWATEYKIDGFRFDLMGLIDTQTMLEIREKLNLIDTKILTYGEGWTGGASALDSKKMSVKNNAVKLKDIGFFNDHIRDDIKGGAFDKISKGFVQGNSEKKQGIKSGIVGSCFHSQVKWNWAANPMQSINYVSAHDNNTLWDKLNLSINADYIAKIKMNLLAATIVMLSQGIAFFTAGEEFLRSKPMPDYKGFCDNSYNMPDFTNAIKWDDKTNNIEVFNYYKNLINFRKNESCLKLKEIAELEFIMFLETENEKVIAFIIEKRDDYSGLCCILNCDDKFHSVDIPVKNYTVVLKNFDFSKKETFNCGNIQVEPLSSVILKF